MTRFRRPRFPHVLLPLLALTACVRPPTAMPRDAGEPSPYRRACASCHGVDGRGGGSAAAALRTAPPDLTLLAARNAGAFPRDLVIATITGARAVPVHGTREMPIWGIRFQPDGVTAVASIVAQQRIDAIVAEVERLQRPAPE